jgi:hydrogenase-4 transcriptional activator
LFLDEIGDLPLELQPKLLRALQEKQVERLGGRHPIQVDVRVVAATNQDLWRMVEDKKFRADLYYRLNVFPIALPPLRERGEDIPLLVDHFVLKFAERQGKTILTIPDGVMQVLRSYRWPGNIRELQNVIERGVIMTTGSILSMQTIANLTKDDAPLLDNQPVTTLADAERAHIAAALRETNGVIGGPRGAASQLGLPRTTLIAKMRRLGISPGSRARRADVPAIAADVSTREPASSHDAAPVFRAMGAAAGRGFAAMRPGSSWRQREQRPDQDYCQSGDAGCL